MHLFALTLLSSVDNPLPVNLIVLDGFDLPSIRVRAMKLSSKFNPVADRSQINARKDTNESVQINISWLTEPSTGRIYTFDQNSKDHKQLLKLIAFIPPSSLEMPSGAPLGVTRIFGGSKSIGRERSINMYCEIPWAVVKVQWTPPMTKGADGFAANPKVDMESREAWVEKLARHTLANAAGFRIEASSSGALAGHNVSRAKRRGSNVMFGDLNQWFSASGWGIAEEDKFGILHLKKGSDRAVLPLGADQIKVNGVWKEMGDSAAFFNGKLYLPEAGLKHLKETN